MADKLPLTISRAARAAGVGVETIRFYERKGIIEQPKRVNGSGFRVYPTATIEKLQVVRRAQTLGFSLREIRELLALQERAETDCAEVRALAKTRLAEVRDKISRLRRVEQALGELARACPGRGQLEGCPIIRALKTPLSRESTKVAAQLGRSPHPVRQNGSSS